MSQEEQPAPASGDVLSNDDIDAIVSSGGEVAADAAATSASTQESTQQATPSHSDMEVLLNQAEAALASVDADVQAPPNTKPFALPELGGSAPTTDQASLELIRDVELDVTIELGRSEMPLEDVLQLRKGSVVSLDKLAGDPVDIFVNGRLVARGEVLVLNENFCVRVAELMSGEKIVG